MPQQPTCRAPPSTTASSGVLGLQRCEQFLGRPRRRPCHAVDRMPQHQVGGIEVLAAEPQRSRSRTSSVRYSASLPQRRHDSMVPSFPGRRGPRIHRDGSIRRVAVGAWLTNAFGLRWLRAFYEEVLWKKCDEVLSFFDRSSSIQEMAGEGKASISDEISAYVRQTMAYEVWEAVCRKLHETLKGWIVLLMFFASIILPLKPIHGGGPRSALMLFTLIPLGAVAILVANSPRHIANSRLWLHLLIYFLTVFAGCTVILAILALASILEAFPFRTWPWWVDDGLRIGLWMVVLSNLLFGLAVATDALIRTFISKRKHAKHPASSIVSSLLSTTLAVEDGTTPGR